MYKHIIKALRLFQLKLDLLKIKLQRVVINSMFIILLQHSSAYTNIKCRIQYIMDLASVLRSV